MDEWCGVLDEESIKRLQKDRAFLGYVVKDMEGHEVIWR